MKKWMKNKLLTIITVVVVAGVGAGSLLNASKLESIFNPGKIKKFENRYHSDNYDYAAGDGEDMNLADEDKKGQGKEEQQQQVLQVSKPQEKKGENDLGIVDNSNKTKKSDKKNGVEFTNSNKNSSKKNSQSGANSGGKTNPNNGPNTKNNTDNGSNNGNTPSDNPNNGSDNPGNRNDTNNNPGNDSNRNDNNIDNPSNGDNTNKKPDDNTSSDSGKDNGDNKISWEDEQLKPRDPVETADGKLTLLTVAMKKSQYAKGDKFSAEDADVTATFEKDGKKSDKLLSYGGSDGYSVVLSTRKTGDQTAVFSYKGMTVRAAYKVLSNYVLLFYPVAYGNTNDWYISQFPGIPLESMDKEAYDALVTMFSFPNNVVVSGNIFNLMNAHKNMIAQLGDADIKAEFGAFVGQNYSTTVFLSEDKDGYLTTMLEGFRYVYNRVLQDSRSYTYYPLNESWDTSGRNLVDVITAVPSGYKIRRVAENAGILEKYTADQVLEGYTGSDTSITVPMGVTKISLKMKSDKVTALQIPQSVENIDTQSIVKNLPNLTEYISADSDKELAFSGYKIIDGVLYSADGKTLLSVPAGKKKVTVPETVTTLAKGCFAGMASDAQIIFKGKTAPTREGATGYIGKIQIPSSDYDVVYKRYMFAFKEEANTITFEDTDGRSNLYVYDEQANLLCYKEDKKQLAAIAPDTAGEYTINDKITSVGAGAFIDCKKLTDIIMGAQITRLGENSLLLPDMVETIKLKAEKVDISADLFGDPQKDGKVSDIAVYVDSGVYESYLDQWTQVLDPVYGKNTAKNLLYKENADYIYEDGVKYQKLSGSNKYRLVSVYQKDKTALQVKEGTTVISSNAFMDCSSLEILSLPQSVRDIPSGLFTDCTALETVICADSNVVIDEASGITDSATVYHAGKDYATFEYENGVIYGKNSAGERTIINVPTNYTGKFSVKNNTVIYGEKAFKNCEGITDFYIQETGSLREIGAYCFEGSGALRQFDLRAEIYLKTIGEGAFKDCHNLTQLLIPDSVTTVSKRMCYNDDVLQNIEVEFATKIEDEAFYGCDSLENELFDKVESIGNYAFYGCRMLRKVVLPETLTSLGESCFENCTLVEEAEINASLPGIPRYCFYGCRSLTRVIFDSSAKSVKNSMKVIGVRAFSQCTTLEKIDLSSFSNLTQIGDEAFSYDISLINIKLPASLQKINASCFESCTSLSILQLDTTKSVTQLGTRVFGDTLPEYLNIWVEDSILSDYETEYQKILDPEYGEGTAEKLLGVINDKVEVIKGVEFEITDEGRILKKASKNISGDYIVPEDTVAIADEAFMGCEKLTGITLPKGINIRLGNRCFKDCTGLLKIELYSTITEWGDETFMNCTSAQRLSIGSSETDPAIEKIGTRAFKNCTGLNSTSSLEIFVVARVWGEECFADCTNLPAIGISTKARDNLEEIEAGAFKGCTSLTAVLNSKYASLKKVGAHAFEDCDTLKQPALPASVTSIGEGCFMNCDNIQYVSIYGAVEEYPKDCFKNCPKLIRTGGTAAAFGGLKRIGESAYEGCVSLASSASWSIGRYRNLETIGANAFKGCKSITTGVVVNSDIKAYIYTTQLAASVTSVGAHAFDGCSGMSNLIFQSATPPSIGSMDLSSMAAGFEMDVPDSKENGDNIYKAYLEELTKTLGEEKAYAVLDSISDGARDRYKEEQDKAKEPETASESSTEKAEETSASTENSTEKSTEKSEESSTGEKDSAEKSTEKTGESSTGEKDSTEKSAEKSEESSTGEKKSTEKSTEKSAESSTSEGKSTEKSTEKSAEKTENSSTSEKKSTQKTEETSTKTKESSASTQKSEEKAKASSDSSDNKKTDGKTAEKAKAGIQTQVKAEKEKEE